MRGRQLLQRGRVPGDADDRVAASREGQRALATDPGRRAGDEDDPAAREGDHARDVPPPPAVNHVRPGSERTSPRVDHSHTRPMGAPTTDEHATARLADFPGNLRLRRGASPDGSVVRLKINH
jgi:hypothetical protein